MASGEQILIGLQRLRDFFDPCLINHQMKGSDYDHYNREIQMKQMTAASEKSKAEAKEAYARFVHALLLKWIDMRENEKNGDGEDDDDEAVIDSKARVNSVRLHLKELSTEEETGPTIVAYLSS